MKINVLLAALLLTCLTAHSVQADNESDRKRYMSDIKKQIEYTTRNLSKVINDKKVRSVEDAEKEAKKIPSLVSKLSKVVGQDKKSQDIVKKYPRDTKDFMSNVKSLKILKSAHFKLDKVPKVCKDLEFKLDKEIKKAIADDDSSQIKKLPKKYKEIGKKIAEKLKAYEKINSEVEKAFSKAKSFKPRSDGWKRVQKPYLKAATKIKEHWKGKYSSTKAKCKDLAKGESHPKVKDAIEKLKDQVEDELSELDTFKRDTEEWLEDVKKVSRLDCKAMENLWRAFCGTIDAEPNTTPDKTTAKKVAKSLETQMKAKIGPLFARQKALVAEANRLSSDPTTKSGAQELLKKINAETPRLKKLGGPKRWRGANHPLIQYSIEYGKQQHSRMENSNSCDLKDVAFPGISAKKGEKRPRPDCVDFGSCTIKEFKPNNSRAKKKGAQQLDKYEKALSMLYNPKIFKDANGNYAFASGIDAKYKPNKAIACVKSGKIRMGKDVVTYDMCDKKYECL